MTLKAMVGVGLAIWLFAIVLPGLAALAADLQG